MICKETAKKCKSIFSGMLQGVSPFKLGLKGHTLFSAERALASSHVILAQPPMDTASTRTVVSEEG